MSLSIACSFSQTFFFTSRCLIRLTSRFARLLSTDLVLWFELFVRFALSFVRFLRVSSVWSIELFVLWFELLFAFWLELLFEWFLEVSTLSTNRFRKRLKTPLSFKNSCSLCGSKRTFCRLVLAVSSVSSVSSVRPLAVRLEIWPSLLSFELGLEALLFLVALLSLTGWYSVPFCKNLDITSLV